MKKKKGEILVENIIFIVLNLVFFGILILFLINQGSGAIFLEKFTAKQVALLIDSSAPDMLMKIDFEKQKDLAEKNGIDFGKILEIDNQNNIVVVSLKEKSSYQYHFFNDVEVTAYPDGNYYVFTVKEEI